MESRKEISDYILATVASEHGMPIKASENIIDTGLDSLGMTFLLIELDTKYGILENIDSGCEYVQLGLDTLTLKDMVNLCKRSLLASTNQVSE